MNSSNSDFIEYSNWALVRDIGIFLKPYKWRFFLASLSRFFGDIAQLYFAYGFALIVTFLSTYNPGEPLGYFWMIISLLTAAYVAMGILRHIAKYVGFKVAERIALDSQIQMIKHLSLLDISWHEKENAGNKLKRIQKGSDGLNRMIRMWITNFIEIGINFVGMIFILSKIDESIGMLMIAFLVTYFFISFFLLKRASTVSQDVDLMEEGVLGLMFQVINNIRTVKVLAMAEKILAMINDRITELFQKIRLRVFRFQSRSLFLNLWIVIFRIGTMIVIVIGISKGRYDVGLLVLFNGYFTSLTKSVEELSETTQDFIVCKYGIARMKKTLEEPIVIDNGDNKLEFPEKWKKIIIKNLSFAYSRNKVLKEVSVEIKRGERVGIVGLSGAGKSTLMKLLLKENENFQGKILFDDISLKQIKKESYLKHVGAVLQDTEVFNFSLRDNIAIASSQDRSEQEFQNALEIAHVNDFINKLPLGVDTLIGEKGIKLSGGERQRLGIARAIYKCPEILFLDEATSHLDLESEEKIRDSLHKFFQQVTAIVIAHRLTTIREMDKIIVIEKGEIVESGSFEELYENKGRLFELWEKQKL